MSFNLQLNLSAVCSSNHKPHCQRYATVAFCAVTTWSQSRHTLPPRRMVEQVHTKHEGTWGGSGRDQLNELPHHLPVRTDERYKNPRVRILCVAAKIRTRYIQMHNRTCSVRWDERFTFIRLIFHDKHLCLLIGKARTFGNH